MNQPGIPAWARPGPLAVFLVLAALTACKPKANTEGRTSGADATTSALTAKLDDIRKAGYPATLEELDAWYPAVPSDGNAATAFTNAFAALVKPSAAALQSVPRTARLPADVKQAITTAMTLNKTARERLHQAALLKQSRYPLDLHAGWQITLPHLPAIKTAAQVLGLEAAIVTDNNRADVAATSIQTELALARSLDAEPTLISHLVQVAVRLMTASHLERVVNQGKLTDAQLSALQTALRAAAADSEGLTRAFAGERCMALPLFDASPDEAMRLLGQAAPGEAPAELDAKARAQWKKNKDREKAFYLEAMNEIIATSKHPFPQGLEAGRKLKARLDQMAALPPDQVLVLSRAMLRALEIVPGKTAASVARLRCAEAGLGVERHRLAHGGELPASIEALTPALLPAVPADPFDGQPLRFKRLAKGYVVYSLGPDQQDGNGLERSPKGGENAPYDITFIVER